MESSDHRHLSHVFNIHSACIVLFLFLIIFFLCLHAGSLVQQNLTCWYFTWTGYIYSDVAMVGPWLGTLGLKEMSLQFIQHSLAFFSRPRGYRQVRQVFYGNRLAISAHCWFFPSTNRKPLSSGIQPFVEETAGALQTDGMQHFGSRHSGQEEVSPSLM